MNEAITINTHVYSKTRNVGDTGTVRSTVVDDALLEATAAYTDVKSNGLKIRRVLRKVSTRGTTSAGINFPVEVMLVCAIPQEIDPSAVEASLGTCFGEVKSWINQASFYGEITSYQI